MCKRLIIFSVIFTSSCLAGIEKLEANESLIDEAVVEILKSCYGNHTTAVGLAGNSTGTISEALWSQSSFPITLIDGTSRKTINRPVIPQFRYRLQHFVVTASSSTYLRKILNEIKASKWWNHMASFFIIDHRISNNGCKNAFEILWSTWKMNLLNAKFLCHHWTNGRLIYTFNPYTNWAPEPWRLDKNYTDKNDHSWTLFVRRYEDNAEENCDNLDFEKANDLGGHQIRVSSTTLGQEAVKPGSICPGLFENILCEILFPALNATPKLTIHESLKTIGFVDEKGNVNGLLGEVVHGITDIALLGRYLAIFTNLTMIYPHYQSDLRSLTQYSGYKSQLTKIRSVFDSNSRYGFWIVCLITVLFFKYVGRESLPIANLNTFRLMCYSSLPKMSRKLGARIYLGSLFIFAITMQGIFQGQLASLLSKQEPIGNVNSMTDLAKLGHVIHGQPLFALYFGDQVFQGRFVGIRSGSCTDFVLQSSKAACVGTPTALAYDALKYKLHMSRKALVHILGALPIRPDWPLEKRVNTVVARMTEAHLIYFVHNNLNFHTDHLLRVQENQFEDQSVKTLTMKQLGFAFAFLGIGLGIATMSFVLEITRLTSRRIFSRKFYDKSVLKSPLL